VPRLPDFELHVFDSIDDVQVWLEEPCPFPDDTPLQPTTGRPAVFPFARFQSLECILELIANPSELTIRSEEIKANQRVADASERTADATEAEVVISREREDREAGV